MTREMVWRFAGNAIETATIVVYGMLMLIAWCLVPILGLLYVLARAWKGFIRCLIQGKIERARRQGFAAGYNRGLEVMDWVGHGRKTDKVGEEIEEILRRNSTDHC